MCRILIHVTTTLKISSQSTNINPRRNDSIEELETWVEIEDTLQELAAGQGGPGISSCDPKVGVPSGTLKFFTTHGYMLASLATLFVRQELGRPSIPSTTDDMWQELVFLSTKIILFAVVSLGIPPLSSQYQKPYSVPIYTVI